MNRSIAALLTGALGLASLAAAQSLSPQPLLPEALEWNSPPGMPAVRAAWVLGSENAEGLYALRVTLAKGGRIPPHTHPDTRYTTVLSGTLYVGFGATEDDAQMVAIPPLGVYVAPANQPHYLWARDGEVVYQEGGMGPTATQRLPNPP